MLRKIVLAQRFVIVVAFLQLVTASIVFASSCYDPINIPTSYFAGYTDKIKSLQLKFTPFEDTVCLPTSSGGCTERKLTRVVMDLVSDTPGAYPVNNYISEVRSQEGSTCSKVPSWLFGDCKFSRVTADMDSPNSMRGDFTLHLEKWASGDWICCKWLSCRHCMWKTRLWERSFDGWSNMPISYADAPPTPTPPVAEVPHSEPSPPADAPPAGEAPAPPDSPSCVISPGPANRKLYIVATTTVDTQVNAVERILTGAATSFLGVGFLTGAVFSEPILKALVPMLNQNLPDQRTDVETPSGLFDQISDVSVKTMINNYFCDLKYKPAETAFLREPNGSFIFRKVQGRDQNSEADRKLIPSSSQFCSIIRPMLENQFEDAPPFSPSPPKHVSDIGTEERLVTASPGDSLWKIAKRNYGNPYLMSVIGDANNLKGRSINVGQSLRVPPFTEIVKSGYLVSRGESLWSISERLTGEGKNYPAMATVNRKKVHSPNRINAMHLLALPDSWKPPSE